MDTLAITVTDIRIKWGIILEFGPYFSGDKAEIAWQGVEVTKI